MFVLVGAMSLRAAPAPSPSPNAAPPPPLHTASTHPMKYYLSLPKNWSANRTWPVLVGPSAHYGDHGKTLMMFAHERDARKADFIVVQPLVINADKVAPMAEYRGPVANAISAADAKVTDGNRDEDARAKFDSEGILAVLKDIRKEYRGEEKVYLTGFSSSTHIAYLFVFAHPEVVKGAVINSGVYLERGVDPDHIPLKNSSERAQMSIKFIIGEADPGLKYDTDNWAETKAELLRYGHPAAKIQTEIIKKGNPEKLNPGHNWFQGRILDFFLAAEAAGRK